MILETRLLERLADLFKRTRSAPVQGFRIQDWRISLFATQLLSTGIKNNTGGSVYTPPAYKDAVRADIFLVWEDGKCSRARVQKPAEGEADNWQRELTLWRMAAFEDIAGNIVPPPAPLPAVKIADEAIRLIFVGNHHYLFDLKRKILSDRPPKALNRANITALWGENAVLTSTGIDVGYKRKQILGLLVV
jgi:PmbA protein